MIPAQNIVAWGNLVPWTDADRSSRTSSSAVLWSRSSRTRCCVTRSVSWRNGAHKLHFPAPLRYSEDIDLVRTAHGPIGPVLDRLRVVLEPWLGRAQFDQSPVAPKFRFRVEPEDGSAGQSGCSRDRHPRGQAFRCADGAAARGRESVVRDVSTSGGNAGDQAASAAAAGQGARSTLRRCLRSSIPAVDAEMFGGSPSPADLAGPGGQQRMFAKLANPTSCSTCAHCCRPLGRTL